MRIYSTTRNGPPSSALPPSSTAPVSIPKSGSRSRRAGVMAAGKKLKASEQLTQKIVALMTGKKLKASEQKLTSIEIIATVWKPVEDPETAIKEANAARLARAKYDQALTSDDPGVVSAMLRDIEDDGTAGAALLKAALQV